MYLDTDIQIDTTYAYYLSGTIVLLKVDNTYGYLGIEPSIYLTQGTWCSLVDCMAVRSS
jgi:hypothetical protein